METSTAEEIARAIYAGKAEYAILRLRETSDPELMTLLVLKVLGQFMDSHTTALGTLKNALENHRKVRW